MHPRLQPRQAATPWILGCNPVHHMPHPRVPQARGGPLRNKAGQALGSGEQAVSWHADSSLEPFSSIAVLNLSLPQGGKGGKGGGDANPWSDAVMSPSWFGATVVQVATFRMVGMRSENSAMKNGGRNVLHGAEAEWDGGNVVYVWRLVQGGRWTRELCLFFLDRVKQVMPMSGSLFGPPDLSIFDAPDFVKPLAIVALTDMEWDPIGTTHGPMVLLTLPCEPECTMPLQNLLQYDMGMTYVRWVNRMVRRFATPTALTHLAKYARKAAHAPLPRTAERQPGGRAIVGDLRVWRVAARAVGAVRLRLCAAGRRLRRQDGRLARGGAGGVDVGNVGAIHGGRGEFVDRRIDGAGVG